MQDPGTVTDLLLWLGGTLGHVTTIGSLLRQLGRIPMVCPPFCPRKPEPEEDWSPDGEDRVVVGAMGVITLVNWVVCLLMVTTGLCIDLTGRTGVALVVVAVNCGFVWFLMVTFGHCRDVTWSTVLVVVVMVAVAFVSGVAWLLMATNGPFIDVMGRTGVVVVVVVVISEFVWLLMVMSGCCIDVTWRTGVVVVVVSGVASLLMETPGPCSDVMGRSGVEAGPKGQRGEGKQQHRKLTF